MPTLRSSLRDRVTVVDDEDAGARRRRRRRRRLARPGDRARRARAGARRRRRARSPRALPVYEEVAARRRPRPALRARRRRRARRAARAARRATSALRAEPRASGAAARGELAWSRVADEVEAIYARLAALRHDPDPQARGARAARQAQADRRRPAHAHRPLAATARRRSTCCWRPPATSASGAIAVTDHNEISGALDARAKAAEYGVKVIVGEEVKTADQGEVIGLFIEEKIPRGMTLAETIAEIRRQGGLVYVPHPFDRMHSVPDYEHMLAVVARHRRDRGLQPADRDPGLQRGGGALRRPSTGSSAARAVGLARRPGARLASASACATSTGPRSSSSRCATPTSPASPPRLRYAQVQALKFLQTKATPPAARAATRRRKVATRRRGARRAVSCRGKENPAAG